MQQQQQQPGFASDPQQQQILHNLSIKCSEYISQQDCFSLLSQSNWNYEWCERILYTIPNVIFSQTGIPKELGLRLILSESNCNEETCQLYVNMVLDFAHKTNLNWWLCVDCLSQAKWSVEIAFEMFQRCKHEIPESGFVNLSRTISVVNTNDEFQDSGDENENITSYNNNHTNNNTMLSSSTTASPCIGGVLLNSNQQLSSSACDNPNMLDNDNVLHENTPESSPNESANILNTGRISIISNYF
ncbi:hypothetical protein FDP41_007800 [Naegleria fowleri]|uniref:TAP-C domain-containing protein n=1 Tax=Naegleria fowleri TaxID=5763 RepID=A0A6A5CF29_NAEFO|nr:uncharacterized protein FDP41_007800 [Naegleria fowleri]KAF0983885.1 hypothetical protein FDP41_007800 [Naegleria fowleri]CAG4713850.1 unnamed protein product [Naegleria fowleri]